MEKIENLGDEFYKSLENKVIYIDSNIFMDEIFRKVLENFESYSLNIVIPKEQYDELYNLKQSSDNEEKKKRARDAFKIIEKLLDLNILSIEDINNKNMNQNAYADSVFIEKVANNLKMNNQIIFFTNDADLRIRIKSLEGQKQLITLYGYKDLKAIEEKEKQRIRDEEYKFYEKIRKEEEERKANRTTSEKVIDGAITVAKGVGVVVAAGAAIFLSSNA